MITGSGPELPPPPEAVTVAIPPLAVAVTLVLKFIEVIPVPTEVPLFSISIPELPPPPEELIVTIPVDPEIVTFVPATIEVTIPVNPVPDDVAVINPAPLVN